MYSPYDTGDPIREMPEQCKGGLGGLGGLGSLRANGLKCAGKMLLRQKRGGWKLQSEMEDHAFHGSESENGVPGVDAAPGNLRLRVNNMLPV